MKLYSFLLTLPLDVALIIWDVMNNHITPETQILATNSTHLHDYEIVAAVAGGNLDYLEGLYSYCQELVKDLIEEYYEYNHL